MSIATAPISRTTAAAPTDQTALAEKFTADPQRVQWAAPAVIAVAAAIVAITLGVSLTRHPGLVAIGVAVIVTATVRAVWANRTNRRRAIEAQLISRVSVQLRTKLTVKRSHWTTNGWPGHLHTITIAYPVSLAVQHATTLTPVVVHAVNKALPAGQSVTVKQHRPRRRTLCLTVVADVAEDLKTPLMQQQDRVRQIVTDQWGPSTATVSIDDNTEEVTGFTITISDKAGKLAKPTARRAVIQELVARLGGEWRHTLDLQHDQIRFHRRTPLPTRVDRPVLPVTDHNRDRIPESVDEDGEIQWWDVSGVMAHQLRAGRTRTGKTVATIGDVIEAARREWQIFVLDPKRIEFLGLREWPNVALVGTRAEDQAAVINHLHHLMDERYRRIEEEGAKRSDFHRILLVIDEYRQLYAILKSWWDTIKPQGISACPAHEQIGGMLRMAAAARIHVILATQRPDAEFVGGETRDNFSARSATGRLSPDGAQMLFDSAHVGTSIPRNVQGRGTIVGLDDHPKEVQFYYTPDPYTATGQERELLDQLRPASTLWPRLTIEYPTDAELTDQLAQVGNGNKKVSIEWERVKAARFVPYTGPTEKPVPVSSAHITDYQPAADDSTFLSNHNDDTPEAEDDEGEVMVELTYTRQMCAANKVLPGDLIEHDGDWVTVDAPPEIDQADVLVDYRTDDDESGELALTLDDLITIKRPTSSRS